MPEATSPDPTPTSVPAVPTDDAHVIRAAADAPSPAARGRTKKVIVLVIVLLILAVGGSGGAFAFYKYFTTVYPAKIIQEAYDKLLAAPSFTVEGDFASSAEIGKFTFLWNYHKQVDKMQSGYFLLSSMQSTPGNNLRVDISANEQDIYLKLKYSLMSQAIAELGSALPEITSLQTYRIIEPALLGTKWLHIYIPPEMLTQDTTQETANTITPAQQQVLTDKFSKSVVIRSFNWNYSKDGVTYSRITLGFDKEKLKDAFQSIKDTNLDIKLSDINQFVTLIDSVPSWNSDLVEILINKAGGTFASIALSVPQIPEDALKKTLEGGTPGESDNLAMLKSLFGGELDKVVGGATKSTSTYIGTISFSNYSAAPVGQAPLELVEFSDVLAAAQVELLPLFGQYLQSFGSPQMGNPNSGSPIMGL